jgi:hypothetical protein
MPDIAITVTKKETYTDPLKMDENSSKSSAPPGAQITQIKGDVAGDSSNVKAQKEMITSLPELVELEEEDYLIVSRTSENGKLYKMKVFNLNAYLNQTVDYNSEDYNQEDHN